jgi:high frequency lysogenization protein
MQNNTQEENITLALAGIIQAAHLVQQFAKTGQYDEKSFETIINSIYCLDPENVISVYKSIDNLDVGLSGLVDLFSERRNAKHQEIGRYMISMIHLAKLLMKNPPMLNNLEKKLRYAISQAEFFHPYHPTVIANLGQTYSDTIGQFQFKLHVIGKPEILSQSNNMVTVRAILLGGIRSAVLWHQMGGKQWQLLFHRKKIAQCAKKLLVELCNSSPNDV